MHSDVILVNSNSSMHLPTCRAGRLHKLFEIFHKHTCFAASSASGCRSWKMLLNTSSSSGASELKGFCTAKPSRLGSYTSYHVHDQMSTGLCHFSESCAHWREHFSRSGSAPCVFKSFCSKSKRGTRAAPHLVRVLHKHQQRHQAASMHYSLLEPGTAVWDPTSSVCCAKTSSGL